MLLRPENVAIISLVVGMGIRGFKILTKKLDKQQNDLIDAMEERLKQVEREVLRLQMLDGMHANRLSYSELLYFYDRYKLIGGNSFIDGKVKEYLNTVDSDRRNIR